MQNEMERERSSRSPSDWKRKLAELSATTDTLRALLSDSRGTVPSAELVAEIYALSAAVRKLTALAGEGSSYESAPLDRPETDRQDFDGGRTEPCRGDSVPGRLGCNPRYRQLAEAKKAAAKAYRAGRKARRSRRGRR